MKKPSSSPHVLSSSKRKQNHGLQQHGTNSYGKKTTKPHPVLRYIRTAAKSVAAIFLWPKKAAPATSASVVDATKLQDRGRRTSWSTDISNGSNISSKSSSRLKYSSSYGSSIGSFGPDGGMTSTSLSIQEICKATQNFSSANKIGEGGFGTVYKGKLKDGSLVAIKRARKNIYDKYLLSEFQNEILTLSKIEHLNLVRLHGYLEQGDERLIVVDYVNNGNLREHLDGKHGTTLEMAERLDIAIDVAHAITYLHMYTDHPIIHRDIKSSNILLTDKMRAKVADFGFARLATGDSDATHISTQIKGTTGYLDPEYLKTYQLTDRSDVYSFGVLLVELMTGRYPIEEKKPIKEKVTAKWAMQRLKQGDAIFVMDPLLRRSPASNRAMEKVLKLASRCLATLRQSRPSMRECGEVLWGIRKELRDRSNSSSSSPSTSYQSADFPKRDARKSRKTSFGIEEDDDNYKFMSA